MFEKTLNITVCILPLKSEGLQEEMRDLLQYIMDWSSQIEYLYLIALASLVSSWSSIYSAAFTFSFYLPKTIRIFEYFNKYFKRTFEDIDILVWELHKSSKNLK